jgi:hypothetical protein
MNETQDMVVQGEYAYLVSRYTSSVTVVDVSNKSAPFVANVFDDGLTNPQGLYLAGSKLYVTELGADTLNVLDITNPLNITRLGAVTDATNLDGARSIIVRGDYAYILESVDDGLSIFNVSDPADMTYIGGVENTPLMDTPRGLDVQGGYAYVVGTVSDNLTVIDVRDPSNPTIIGNITGESSMDGANYIVVSGDYAYVTSQNGGYLNIIDISDPTSPFIVTIVGGNAGARQRFTVAGRYAYVTAFTIDTFNIIDLHGGDIHAASIGAVGTTTTDAREAEIGGTLFANTGLAVGSRGIHTDGDLVVARHSDLGNFTKKTTGVAKTMYLTNATYSLSHNCDDDPSTCCEAGYHMCTTLEFLEGGRRIEDSGTDRDSSPYSTTGDVDPAADAPATDCTGWSGVGTGRYACQVTTSLTCAVYTPVTCGVGSSNVWCCSD